MTNSHSSAVDYTGAPLRAGQNVAFIGKSDGQAGQPRLYTGEIKLIGDWQLVVESGDRFFTIEGADLSSRVGKEAVAYWGILGLPSPAVQ